MKGWSFLNILACTAVAVFLSGCSVYGGKTTSTIVSAQSEAAEAQGNPENTDTDEEPSEKVVLRFAGTVPDSSPAYAECEWFCQQVLEDSDGTLQIDFYPYNQLGDDFQVMKEIIDGTIDMGLLNPVSSYTPMATVGMIPGVAFTEEEFQQYYGPGSYLDKITNDALAEVGITCFGTYFGGFTGIATNKEVTAPADPTADKNAMIRSPIGPGYESAIEALGFKVAPMAYSMAHAYMEKGLVDGYGGGMPHTVIASFDDVVTCYYDYNLVPSAMCAMINTKVYDGLSEEHRKILSDRYTELVERSYTAFGDYESKCLDYLEENGVKVFRFTDEERADYVRALREIAWKKLEPSYGQEFFEELRRQLGLIE